MSISANAGKVSPVIGGNRVYCSSEPSLGACVGLAPWLYLNPDALCPDRVDDLLTCQLHDARRGGQWFELGVFRTHLADLPLGSPHHCSR
ncbi:MAG: hypothetical protein F6K11_36090 [Leptolyngbya sp. SIO3F4]|nr:hypothetical protein [Leptolyngbya sp. SIO3F4]